MKPPRRPQTKIRSLAQLKRILQSRGKQKIVFTNGCFDLLHAGHVTYLHAARKLGTSLVVALNDDASVRRLKGKSRPLNSLADRMRVLAALECVDYVTWFQEDTPLQAILLLRPDILVKGGDWRAADIVGAQEVRSWGGRVRPLGYVPGKSTTGLIRSAKSTR